MLVKLVSDLHLGYKYPEYRYVDHGESVLILAGDISTGMKGIEWAEEYIPKHIKVLYVPGNHEYYGYDYALLQSRYAEYNRKETNIQIMLNDCVEIDNIEFYGTTLWTDFNLYGVPEFSGSKWQRGLNDANFIKYRGSSIIPQNFINWNKESLDFLSKVKPSKTSVLITHYCPDLSIHHVYRDDPLTPGFATKIPKEIHEKFNYHFHGHTHCSMNYSYSYGTKVRCNPKGYGAENGIEFNEELVLDIG
jgi:predicted phosphohydrolase